MRFYRDAPRMLRRYLSEHAKTDTADAYVLGAIPLFGGVPTDPVYVPDAERHALQRLTRQRDGLEEELNSIKRRLLDLVRWACPAIEAALPDFRTHSPCTDRPDSQRLFAGQSDFFRLVANLKTFAFSQSVFRRLHADFHL
jgi:transposase